MAKQKTVWLAEDETPFDSEEEAHAHDVQHGKAVKVAQILSDHGLYAVTARGTALAIIECWDKLKTIVEAEDSWRRLCPRSKPSV